uniref:Uncharacterized protein n=1 Tax=Schistosoma japonicum TaxID=6182 RepID=Q5BZM0_SCHJA|nr:unknown [Schistosoma japonicum]
MMRSKILSSSTSISSSSLQTLASPISLEELLISMTDFEVVLIFSLEVRRLESDDTIFTSESLFVRSIISVGYREMIS